MRWIRARIVDLHGIRFKSGKDRFKPSPLPTLRAVSKWMGNAPGQRFMVRGQTDSDGSTAYNQKLSERRAATVADWLADHGIDRAGLGIEPAGGVAAQAAGLRRRLGGKR